MVVCLSPYCMIYNSSWAKDFFLSHIIPYFFLSHIIQYLHGRFFRRWNFHRKTIIDNVMFPYISLLCPTFTLWPRKSSIFPIFVIFVIYNPRFCPFVHFVIVQYCIYCPIYRPILYLCFLGGNHPRNIHQKYGYHCWWRTCLGPFLAKTSRTAVLTAIMDLSAGGRLYKCLYKMHVASRAFWGAFWGAFRVFLRDVGWGETRWPPGPLESPATAQQTALRWTF